MVQGRVSRSAHRCRGRSAGDDPYWLYPTASDGVPTVATANATGDISNPGANVVNYAFGADWNGQNGNVTTVGSAGALSDSFYGTSDQGGNVWKWNETVIAGSNRGLRCGSWNDVEIGLRSSLQSDLDPTGEFYDVGFRVATPVGPIPTVSAWGMTALVLLVIVVGTAVFRREKVAA